MAQAVFWIIAAWAGTVALLPAVIKFAWRIGALDVPGEARRIHKTSVPRIGGLAVFSVFAAVVFLSGAADVPFRFALAGASVVFTVGFVDDLIGLPAWVKFFFQAVAAAFSIGGIQSRTWIGAFAAFFWVLLLTNAHNLIDGMDGLFAGTAVFESIGLAVAFVFLGLSPLVPLLLAAVCIGFYHFNRSPARIFAGDCGSGSVGFLLGMLSLPLFAGQSWGLGFLAPIFIMGYPLADVATTILRRSIRRRPLFMADRGHLHHLLFDFGLSGKLSAGILQGVGAAIALLGELLMRIEFAPYAAVVSLLCIVVLLVARHAVVLRSGRGNIGKTVDFSGSI